MSTYNQKSFAGGMNMRVDDTRLDPTQYRVAFNIRNRTDTLAAINLPVEDLSAPPGLKQGIITFGTNIILFVSGAAYYRSINDTAWRNIPGFSMSPTVNTYWTQFIPVNITNYQRLAIGVDVNAGINLKSLSGLASGNIPGLLVQDGINQPQFMFINTSGYPEARTTQTYGDWSVDWTAYTIAKDKREYVPIGKSMAFVDGILWIVASDQNRIYRSVSGRPLDFVIMVDTNGYKDGNADVTAYTVGARGITTIRQMSDNSLFVGAENSAFAVNRNIRPDAPTICGEPTFIRRFLFNATCISDDTIMDSLGDTRFIDITGVRSFNAVLQLQNEGRNSSFTADIVDAFKNQVQVAGKCASILYNNDELYSVKTIYGYVTAVYDSIQQRWVGFDKYSTMTFPIKQFAKIEATIQKLYAITDDNKLFELFASEQPATAYVRTVGINSANLDIPNANLLKHELKPLDFRCVFNRITKDMDVTLDTFVNNRLVPNGGALKHVLKLPPGPVYTGAVDMSDTDIQLSNLFWATPNTDQGWKVFYIISWTGGAILTQFSATFKDETPMNPLLSQGVVQ